MVNRSDRKAGSSCSVGVQVHDRQPGEPPFDFDKGAYLPPELQTTKAGWDAVVTIAEPLWAIHRAPVPTPSGRGRPAGAGNLVRCASSDPNTSKDDVNALAGESLADLQVRKTDTPWLMRKAVVEALG